MSQSRPMRSPAPDQLGQSFRRPDQRVGTVALRRARGPGHCAQRAASSCPPSPASQTTSALSRSDAVRSRASERGACARRGQLVGGRQERTLELVRASAGRGSEVDVVGVTSRRAPGCPRPAAEQQARRLGGCGRERDVYGADVGAAPRVTHPRSKRVRARRAVSGEPLDPLAVRRHRHPQRLELAARPAGAEPGVDARATVDDGEIREAAQERQRMPEADVRDEGRDPQARRSARRRWSAR